MLLSVLVSSLAHAAIEGENVGKSLRAVRATTAPQIDGRLDDVVWQVAPADGRFVQAAPQDGRPASERTEVRIVYDDDAVYVGIHCYDSEPGRIVSRLARRDKDVEADWIAIGFDSRHDHASGYGFMLNAAGVQTDVLHYDDTSQSSDWDAVWDGAVAHDRTGWTAEFRLPLSALRFSSEAAQVWGFNAVRYISRKKEEQVWSHVPQGVNAAVSRWGHVQGIEGIRPRRTLELRPYVAASAHTSVPSGGAFLGHAPGSAREGHVEVGVDLKLGVTSSLTLDATVNPDFGQVEADPAVLNLSRFESYFPEKRPFFLEGSDIFALPIQVFYSRRIGRPPSGLGVGDEVDDRGRTLRVVQAPTALRLATAAKLTGTVGSRLTLGVLDAVTGPERFTVVDDATQGQSELEGAPARNYAAARARWSLGGASSVGLLATAVTWLGDRVARASADHDAYVQSADARWAPGSGDFSLRGQLVVSERVGGPRDDDGAPIVRPDGTRMLPGDVGLGAFAQADYSSEHWWWSATYRTYSPHFDVNDFGFVQQTNQHVVETGGGWRDQEPRGVFVRRSLSTSARAVADWDGVVAESSVAVSASATWSNYWSSYIGVRQSGTWLWNPYETGDGAYLERLPYFNADVWTDTDRRQPFSVGAGAGGGLALGDTAYYSFAETFVSVNDIPQAELELGAMLHWEGNDLRMLFDEGCVEDPATGTPCTIDSTVRHYRMAEITDGSLSLTLRGSYIVSPTLSLQAYAQLFLAQGSFDRHRTVTTTGLRPHIHRDRLVVDPSFVPPEQDFQDTSLDVNLVLRWELSPGTTLLGVYTRAQNADVDLGAQRPRFRLKGLGTGPTEEVLLMKLVYFYG